MDEEQRISAEFAAQMMGGELSGDPADPDTPLGRFIASELRDRDAVLAAWAESGVTPESLRGDPSSP